jgi:macrolide transport system ATP-binding/permease protein
MFSRRLHQTVGTGAWCEASRGWRGDRRDRRLDADAVAVEGTVRREPARSGQLRGRLYFVNETFARKYFPNADPLGKHFGLGDAPHAADYEVVGVVADAKYEDARDVAWPTFFRPLLQTEKFRDQADQSAEIRSNWIHDIELRVSGRPQNLQPLIRETLASIDPNMPVVDMMTFGEQVTRNFNQDRLMARLAGIFGLLALALASIGLACSSV